MPAESMSGNLLQRDFDHDLFQQSVGYLWTRLPHGPRFQNPFFVSARRENFGRLDAKQGLSTETIRGSSHPPFLFL